MTEEIIYSRGEVSQLLKATITHLRDMDFSTDRNAVTDFTNILKYLTKKHRTLSEGFFDVLVKRSRITFLRYADDNSKVFYDDCMSEILRVLFQEDLGKIPLLMNNPVTGYLAMFRLRIGR